MFKISKENLFYRCGSLPANDVIIENATPLKEVMVDGEKIVIGGNKYIYRDGTFHVSWCLKTHLGYIDIDKVNSYLDIWKSSKYNNDHTEWVTSYDDMYQTINSKDEEQIEGLKKVLKRKWKNIN